MINARSETVAEKPAFRTSLRKRRCLIVADGFYEWQQAGTRKQPFHFSLKNAQPFAMAGLWDLWTHGSGEVLETFTILTTRPNELVAAVHDRMPVILSQDSYDLWLNPKEQDPNALLPLLTPCSSDTLTASAVSTYVNNPSNNGPRCTEPISVGPP